jgi:hypothetical protein
MAAILLHGGHFVTNFMNILKEFTAVQIASLNIPTYFFSNSPVLCRLTNVVLPVAPSPTRTSCNEKTNTALRQFFGPQRLMIQMHPLLFYSV